MKKIINNDKFRNGFLNPTGHVGLIKKIDNDYYYLYLSDLDKRYIKLHKRFIFLKKDIKKIEITLNLYWDTVSIFDNDHDWDAALITQVDTSELYKIMSISWHLGKRDSIKLEKFIKENK